MLYFVLKLKFEKSFVLSTLAGIKYSFYFVPQYFKEF